ncbi:hypothetical protein EVG20_g1341 [Dentipellis fragilis]|uniref:Uncharacterized protein n=1 Tax=Dentipellis fragilis TaxID=205917 RepID=A0A4Y9ZE20_9AGAM|nr:hypothetical protein EVG20_g1341 [Dentipellis fragilis]
MEGPGEAGARRTGRPRRSAIAIYTAHGGFYQFFSESEPGIKNQDRAHTCRLCDARYATIRRPGICKVAKLQIRQQNRFPDVPQGFWPHALCRCWATRIVCGGDKELAMGLAEIRRVGGRTTCGDRDAALTVIDHQPGLGLVEMVVGNDETTIIVSLCYSKTIPRPSTTCSTERKMHGNLAPLRPSRSCTVGGTYPGNPNDEPSRRLFDHVLPDLADCSGNYRKRWLELLRNTANVCSPWRQVVEPSTSIQQTINDDAVLSLLPRLAQPSICDFILRTPPIRSAVFAHMPPNKSESSLSSLRPSFPRNSHLTLADLTVTGLTHVFLFLPSGSSCSVSLLLNIFARNPQLQVINIIADSVNFDSDATTDNPLPSQLISLDCLRHLRLYLPQQVIQHILEYLRVPESTAVRLKARANTALQVDPCAPHDWSPMLPSPPHPHLSFLQPPETLYLRQTEGNAVLIAGSTKTAKTAFALEMLHPQQRILTHTVCNFISGVPFSVVNLRELCLGSLDQADKRQNVMYMRDILTDLFARMPSLEVLGIPNGSASDVVLSALSNKETLLCPRFATLHVYYSRFSVKLLYLLPSFLQSRAELGAPLRTVHHHDPWGVIARSLLTSHGATRMVRDSEATVVRRGSIAASVVDCVDGWPRRTADYLQLYSPFEYPG